MGSSGAGPASGIAAGLTAMISSIVARSLLLDPFRQIDPFLFYFLAREKKEKVGEMAVRCIIRSNPSVIPDPQFNPNPKLSWPLLTPVSDLPSLPLLQYSFHY